MFVLFIVIVYLFIVRLEIVCKEIVKCCSKCYHDISGVNENHIPSCSSDFQLQIISSILLITIDILICL